MGLDRSFPLLLVCFYLSGLAALIYEIRRPSEGGERFYLLRVLHPRRAEGVLDAMTDPVDRRVGRALLDARTGMARSARTQLEGVLRSHPQHREARGEWLRLASAEIRAGLDVERVVVAPLDTLIVAAQLLGKRNPRRQSLADAGLALARSLPADAAHDSLRAHAVRELELRRAGRADGS